MPVRRFAAALLCALFVLAGCDTTDPVEPASPADVAGTYSITEFLFNPTAGAIADANVLARLEPGATLDLLNTQRGGQFQLRYEFTDALPDLISGTFTVSRDEVVLTVREEDRPSLSGLLLNSQIALARESETELSRVVTKSVNLEAFDPEEYGGAGLTNVQGVLTLRLVRQGDER